MNELELGREEKRVVSTVLRVRFVEVRREEVLGVVRDDDVCAPGESVVKVPQTLLQAQTRVTQGQGHAAHGLSALLVVWTITTSSHS